MVDEDKSVTGLLEDNLLSTALPLEICESDETTPLVGPPSVSRSSEERHSRHDSLQHVQTVIISADPEEGRRSLLLRFPNQQIISERPANTLKNAVLLIAYGVFLGCLGQLGSSSGGDPEVSSDDNIRGALPSILVPVSVVLLLSGMLLLGKTCSDIFNYSRADLKIGNDVFEYRRYTYFGKDYVLEGQLRDADVKVVARTAEDRSATQGSSPDIFLQWTWRKGQRSRERLILWYSNDLEGLVRIAATVQSFLFELRRNELELDLSDCESMSDATFSSGSEVEQL